MAQARRLVACCGLAIVHQVFNILWQPVFGFSNPGPALPALAAAYACELFWKWAETRTGRLRVFWRIAHYRFLLPALSPAGCAIFCTPATALAVVFAAMVEIAPKRLSAEMMACPRHFLTPSTRQYVFTLLLFPGLESPHPTISLKSSGPAIGYCPGLSVFPGTADHLRFNRAVWPLILAWWGVFLAQRSSLNLLLGTALVSAIDPMLG